MLRGKSDDAEGKGSDEESGDGDAEEDSGERGTESDIEGISDEGAGPGAGAWERDCDEDDEAEGAVFLNGATFEVRTLFEFGDEGVEIWEIAKEAEEFANEEEDKRDGKHIAEDGYEECEWERKTSSDAEGESATEFDDGGHSHEEGRDSWGKDGVRKHKKTPFSKAVGRVSKTVELYHKTEEDARGGGCKRGSTKVDRKRRDLTNLCTFNNIKRV